MAPAAPARVVGVERTQGAASGRLAGLANRFVELFTRRLSRTDFAAEVARLIADAVKVRAVVILGYDPRNDRLELLGDQGLTDAARAALGGGGECPWDIPLRGLRNRRISVIAAAHQNPFVPRALVGLSPNGLSIASLPIYSDYEPAGVLLLCAAGKSTFPDVQLQSLSQALRVCARGLREADGPAERAGRGRPEDAQAVIAKLIAEGAIIDPAESAAAESQPADPGSESPAAPSPEFAARVQELEAQLAKVQHELDRSAQTVRSLTASGNAVARERDALSQQLADFEGTRDTAGAELRAELAALEERLVAVDSERARHQRMSEARRVTAQQAVARLEGERDSLLERVQTAESSVAELQAGLAALRDQREQLTARVESLTGEVRAGIEAREHADARYAEERASIEADRDGWKEQSATVRAQLAQRTENLAAVERELRGTTVARDAAAAQLDAARGELERLAAQAEEVERTATQAEAGRASAVAEAAAIRRALEDERARHQQAEQALRAELNAAQAENERVVSGAAVVRADLAEYAQAVAARDQQIAQLRLDQEAARQAEAGWQERDATLRAELATRTAQLQQTTLEHQQLADERTALRAAVAEARQHAAHTEVAHAAAVGELQAELAELRRHGETLAGDRTVLADSLQRAQNESRDLTNTLNTTQRRNEELQALLRQRDATLGSGATERTQLAEQIAALSGQLQASADALERAQARHAQERAAIERDHDGWKEQAAAARAELAQRTETVVGLEREARAAAAARDVVIAELETEREARDQLATLTVELQHSVAQLEGHRDAGAADNATLRHALDDERAARAKTEQGLGADLAAARTEAERLNAASTALRSDLSERTRALADREERLAGSRAEIEALRQQSADRGVLAQQAGELGAKVVELEQALAAARGEGARAERQRAAFAEKLDAAHRRETDAAASASRELTSLQEALQQLSAERERLETERTTHVAELDGLHSTLADANAALECVRTERTAIAHQAEETARRLTETERLVAQRDEVLRQRDGAATAAAAERQRLVTQLETVRAEVRAGYEALEVAQARYEREQRAIDADRDGWKTQASTARADAERLAGLVDELRRKATHLDAARTATQKDVLALQQTLEEERATAGRTAHTLRANLSAAQADGARGSAELETLRAEIAERDAELVALRQRDEAARQAESEFERSTAALRAEVAQLSSRVEERSVECQQLSEGRAALERQLALVAATHGEEEQALAQGLQAAREQVAELEHERAALQTTVADVRQQLREAGDAQIGALGKLQADTAELRKQLKTATAARATLTKRLERAEADLTAQSARADEESRRAAALAEEHARFEHTIADLQARRAASENEAAQSRAESASLTVQLQESTAACEQLRTARMAVERDLVAALSAGQEQQQTHVHALHAVQQHVAHLEQEHAAQQALVEELQERLAGAEAVHASTLQLAHTEADELRAQLIALQAARDEVNARLEETAQILSARSEQLDGEQRRAALLAERHAQLHHVLAAAETRVGGREGELAQARAEIDALRQQSEDRGVLAHQASELGSKVVDLEQQLAALRGEAAQAERQRAVLAEELGAARAQQAQADAAAEREQTELRTALQLSAAEQDRLESAYAERAAEIEAQRASFAEMQSALEHMRAERLRVEEGAVTTGERLSDTERRAEELQGLLRQRDAALDTANADRKRLAAQTSKLTSQLRAEQETVERIEGRYALERSTMEADRNAWQEHAAQFRAEQGRAAAVAEELNRTAAEAEAARAAAVAENATLRGGLEDARAAEESLRTDVAALQTETQRLTTDTTALRAAVAARDAQLAAAHVDQEAARQAESRWNQANATLRAEVAAVTLRLDDTTAEMQRVHDTRETLARQLELMTAARGEETEGLSQGLQAARDQIAQLEQERTGMHSALNEARQQSAQTAAAHTEALRRLQADGEELRQQVKALTQTRSTMNERLEQAERALATQGDQLQAENGRAAALAQRCAHLEQSLAAANDGRSTLDAALTRTRTEVEALRQQSADRGVLARQATELDGKVHELEEQLATGRGESARMERQRAALAEELETVRQRQTAALAAAERQQAALQESVQRLTEQRTKLEAEKAAQGSQMEAQRTALADLRATLEQVRTERVQAEEDGQDAAHRVAEMHQRIEELSERLRQRDAAVDGVIAERRRLEDSVRAAEAAVTEISLERDELRRQAEAPLARREDQAAQTTREPLALKDAKTPAERAVRGTHGPDARGRYVLTPEPEEPADAENKPLVIERSAPLDVALDVAGESVDASGAEAPAEVQIAAAPAGEMVLIDAGTRGDEACGVLKHAGFEIMRVAPNDADIDDLIHRKLTCVLLNLAAGPVAWRTLKMLRERAETRTVPILAYLMAPDAQKGFCFGRADFGVRPMEPERIAERLEHLRPKLKRLLAVSADVDGMGKIREPLAKAGVATSVVLDGKQALEFTTIVQPEAALLHLTPDCAGVARAIVGIRADESARHLPLMILLDKAPNREDAFFALVARELSAKGTFQFSNLPGEIAKLLA